MTTSRPFMFAVVASSGLAMTCVSAEVRRSREPERKLTANGGALTGHRYRVIVSTDNGGFLRSSP